MTITKEVIKDLLRICDHKGVELLAIKAGIKRHEYAIITTWASGTKYRVGYYDYHEEAKDKYYTYSFPSARLYTDEFRDAEATFCMLE